MIAARVAPRALAAPHRTRIAARRAAMASSTRSSAASTVVVPPSWLHSRLGNVKVLDATWYMPNWQKNEVADFRVQHIPGAAFFHLDGVADRSIPLPHMMPSAQARGHSTLPAAPRTNCPLAVRAC
jgi:hypothetical protein